MKHIFKDTNTIVIQGWMINKFKLSGNDLIVFALIYGFSQDGQSEFYGSLSYICSAVNCSKPTAIKTINSLVEKNLICKSQNSIGGVVFSKYKVNIDFLNSSKETLHGVNIPNETGKEPLLDGGKETLHNSNILNNNTIDNSQRQENCLFPLEEIPVLKKESDKETSFRNSSAYDLNFVKKELSQQVEMGIDVDYYFNVVSDWSDKVRKKRTARGWMATIRSFMRTDLDNKKLKYVMGDIPAPASNDELEYLKM